MACSHVSGSMLLNEIHVSPPGDADYEYIELRSTTPGEYTTSNGLITGIPLTILLIDANGGNIGEVVEAWRLAYEVPGVNPGDPVQVIPYKTGTNSLLLLGDGYTKLPKGGPWAGLIEAATEVGDPSSPTVVSPAGGAPINAYSGMKPGNIKPNGGVNTLLVAGYAGITNRGGLTTLGDIDIGTSSGNATNNNIYDWVDATRQPGAQATVPWTTLVDSVGWTEVGGSARVPYTGASTNVSLRTGVSASGITPSTLSRYRPGVPAVAASANTANSREAWYGGTITGGTPETISYTVVFGGITGEATPGRQNRNTNKPAPTFLINELALNPPGIDGNFEFIEIINKTVDPETNEFYASLSDYALLLVDSSGANNGRIQRAYDLSKYSTGSNGLLLVGDGYQSGYLPWGNLVSSATHLADPSKPALDPTKWSNLGANELTDNNGFTLLLVKGYTASVASLDTVVTTDGTGVTLQSPSICGTVMDMIGSDEFAIPPGSEVGPISNAPAGRSCAAAGKFALTITGVASPNNFYAPELMARKADSSVAKNTSAWYGGKFGPRADPQALGLSNGYYFGGFKGQGTPGSANYSLANQPVAGTLLLNEVHLNPPSASDATEYVEVINPAGNMVGMNGVSLLVINGTPGGRGVINVILDLTGMSTGANGLAFFSDGVEEASNLWRVGGYLSPLTLSDDPRAFSAGGVENTSFNLGPDSLNPNTGIAVLLVKGLNPAVVVGQDLDADNDGVFDSTPWTTLLDSISFGESVDPSIPLLSGISGYTPGNLSRYNGNATANTTAAWFGGELKAYGNALADLTSVEYTTNYFGSFKGFASPARPNPTVPYDGAATFIINEVNINPPGADNDKEFIEIRNVGNTAASTNGYTLLLLDSEISNASASTGTIVKAISLDGLGTGSNGLLLLGHNYTEANRLLIPWNGTTNVNGIYAPKASPQTALGSPPGLLDDVIGGSSDNGALSLLLVKSFNQREGLDLDGGLAADGVTVSGVADDGVLDIIAWQAPITDALAMKFWNANRTDDNGNPLPPALEGTIYGGVDLSQGASFTSVGYTPDTVARYRSSTTASSAAAWFGGNIAGTSSTSTAYETTVSMGAPLQLQYFPPGFIGRVTPGLPNTPSAADDATDTDHDCVSLLLEEAQGMNPAVHDRQLLPTYGSTVVGPSTYPTLTFRELIGGSGSQGIDYSAQGFLYEMQSSTDLTAWTTTGASLVGIPVVNGDGTQTVTVRSNLPITGANPRQFLRMRTKRN